MSACLVCMIVVMRVLVRMIVRVIMRSAQPPRTEEIDGEAHHRDRNGFVVVDGLRFQQPLERLENHERGDAEQKDRAGIAAEHFDLPGSERIATVARMTPRECIGKCR